MEHAIRLLEKERELIVEDLKNGKKDRLDDLKDFLDKHQESDKKDDKKSEDK